MLIAVPLELFHIGEELIAEILTELAERTDLGNVQCELTGRSFAEEWDKAGVIEAPKFYADEASVHVDTDAGTYDCDGEQSVDVLCVAGGKAVAIEAKLGTSRVTPSEFQKRFCVPCEVSRHADRRLRGNMIAVLQRSFADACPRPGEVSCRINGHCTTLSTTWWLFLGRSVITQWRKTNQAAFLGPDARVADFDKLVQRYGFNRFDALVGRIIGDGFCRRWGLG